MLKSPIKIQTLLSLEILSMAICQEISEIFQIPIRMSIDYRAYCISVEFAVDFNPHTLKILCGSAEFISSIKFRITSNIKAHTTSILLNRPRDKIVNRNASICYWNYSSHNYSFRDTKKMKIVCKIKLQTYQLIMIGG